MTETARKTIWFNFYGASVCAALSLFFRFQPRMYIYIRRRKIPELMKRTAPAPGEDLEELRVRRFLVLSASKRPPRIPSNCN